MDFCTDAFYIRRKEKIKSRLEELENNTVQYLVDKVTQCWNDNFGVNAVGCNWRDSRSQEDGDEEGSQLNHDDPVNEKDNKKFKSIICIVECFPIKVITTVIQTLAEDMKNRSGLPDLLLWKKQHDSDKHEHLFCEVKGPGDKLSEKQIIWIDLLTKAGAKIEVCHVKVRDGSLTDSGTPPSTKSKRKSIDSPSITFADDYLWKQLEDENDGEDSSSDIIELD